MNRMIYTLLLYLLLPLTPLKLLWRGRKQPEYLAHWGERFGFYSHNMRKPVIWLHCVSVGETRAAEPLVKALLEQYPQHQIVLTHATPTGRATGSQLFGDKIQSVYLPYDVPFAVKRFLQHFKPAIGIIMETELWFNLIAACKQQHIPLLLLNARLSEKSAKGYQKLGRLVREGLQDLSAIAAQTGADAARLKQLGAGQVQVMGNIKFDVAPHDDAETAGLALRKQLGSHRPVFLAASTRDGEEILILDAVSKANISNLLTMIVPRHPQRFDEVAELLKEKTSGFIRRSSIGNDTVVNPQTSFVLGDSMGEMFTYYASCDVAFIGGSLQPLGGQNLIEACSMGKPVMIGPHTFNFMQASEMAVDAGAAIRVMDSDELAEQLKLLFADPEKQNAIRNAALAFTAANRGANQRALQLVEKFLSA